MIFWVYARATIKWLLVLLPIAQRCMDFDTAIVGTEFTKITFYELFSTATPANRAQRGDFRHYMKVRFTTTRRIRFLLTLSIAKSSELYWVLTVPFWISTRCWRNILQQDFHELMITISLRYRTPWNCVVALLLQHMYILVFKVVFRGSSAHQGHMGSSKFKYTL